MALLFNIGSYEIGYTVIVIVPIFWWCRSTPRRQKLNLSAVWYLFPAMKVIYLLLLMTSGSSFYRSDLLESSLVSGRSLLEWLSHYLGILGDVYRQTFVTGWQEALSTFGQREWIVESMIALAVTAAVALYLGRDGEATPFLRPRHAARAFIGGLLFILPSVGVLLWLDKFNRDPWRMYVYVPIGAAVAVVSLLMLATSVLANPRFRKLVIVAASLLLIFPATSRLFVQHANIVDSANAKTRVLRQIAEQAPEIDTEAYAILLTDMNDGMLRARGISEFGTNMLDGAIYVLYDGNGPQFTFLCVIGVRCLLDDVSLSVFNLHEGTVFSNLVLFRLHQDLTVELLRELPPELGLDDRGSYNPDRLIDYAAPLPPRAVSMLGAGR